MSGQVSVAAERRFGLNRQYVACRYLMGTRFTEADVRLWTTLLRFDAVYVQARIAFAVLGSFRLKAIVL